MLMYLRVQVTLLAIRATREHMKLGMRESEVRRMIIGALSAAGLEVDSALTLFGGVFRTLIYQNLWLTETFLENAALPHGSGTDRVLTKEDYVLIDCGGSLHGYYSDVTRVCSPRSPFSVLY